MSSYFFIIGTMLGGLFGVVCMCCLQINRLSERKEEDNAKKMCRYGKSSGRSGNYSTNYQISGRELMTPDEVRMLDNRYALLFVRGERPVMDFKYDIFIKLYLSMYNKY